MSTTHQYLLYTVFLNDEAYYNSRFGGGPGAELATPDDKLFRTPADAAHVYGADLATVGTWPGGDLPIQFDPRDAFSSPSVRSTWFGSTANSKEEFPLDVLTFERRSGGWFGIPWLFGDKTIYHWVGRFEYAPDVGSGVAGPVVPVQMPRRRWIDGAELPTQGESGSGVMGNKVSRAASRHTQGYGFIFDNVTSTKIHAHDENGAVLQASAWERLYVRVVRYPTSESVIWKCRNSITANGMMVTCLPTGQIQVNNWDGFTAVPVGTAGSLPLNTWVKIDLVYKYAPHGGIVIVVPYFKVYINGTKLFENQGIALTGLDLTANVTQSIVGGGTPAGAANGFIWHLDDWIGGDEPLASYEIGGTADFIVGSRVALIGAAGDALDRSNWVGDWRLTRQRPAGTGNTNLTSSTAGAVLSLLTDAAIEVDGQATSQGIIALDVGLFSDKGGAGANGTLGWKLPGGVDDYATTVQGFGSFAWSSRLYRPALIAPLTPLGGLEIKHQKGASTDPAKVKALMAVVEILGVFGEEDRYPQGALGNTIGQPVGEIALGTGIHNAPYPHTPWARQGPAPISPVMIKAGTYVGSGTALDLKFRVPIHFLWIRPLTGGAGGTQWFSSMNGPHQQTQAFAPDTILEVLIDPTFVEGGAVETDMTLPAPPDTLEEAVATSNQLAYGFPHNNVDYVGWANYLDDPDYYFKRMLGWLSEGGPDQAVAGLYAVPPSPWLSTQQQQTLVRLAGANADSNANGVTYAYIAFGDPGMRFSIAGQLAAVDAIVDVNGRLANEQFTPEALFAWKEQDQASSTVTAMFKGLGSAAAAISVFTLAEQASAIAKSVGTLTYKANFGLSGLTAIPFIAFRRDDGSGEPGVARVVQLATWIGDGAASRVINLTPASGRRPAWAMVVGHNGIVSYRDTEHTANTSTQFPNTAQTTGITAGGIDAVTVGLLANANGIVYDLIVFPGGTLACNGGFSCPGEYFPVPPGAPTDGPWDPTPEPPEPDGPDGPPDPNFPAGRPPADFGTQCKGASTLIINQALSRIGVSKQIGDIVLESTDEAVAARLHYSSDVDQTLRDFPWPFATHYATLVKVAGPPGPVASPDWLYSYRRPSDCVFERRICLPRGPAIDPTPPPFQLGNDDDIYTTPPIIAIVGNSVAAQTVVETVTPHGYVPGQEVIISSNVGSIPPILGHQFVVAVIDPTHFSLDINVGTPGVGGFVGGAPFVSTPGGGLIFTNQAGAVLEYTARPECAAGRGDPLFRDALTWRHAASIAPSLSRMTDAAINATKMYFACIDLARSVLRPGNPGRPSASASAFDLTAAQLAANLAVVNRGLVRIGAQTIASLLNDQGREATAARLIFEDELQATLADFPWAFATAYADPLVLVGGTATVPVNADWQYSYRVPANLVLARRLVRRGLGRRYDPDPPAFRLGSDAFGALLFTNVPPTEAILEYTVRLDGVVLRSDPLFKDAFGWRLAASLAPSLAMPDPERTEQLGRGADDPMAVKQKVRHLEQLRMTAARNAWQMYFRVIGTAEVGDAREQQQEPEGLPDWLMGRQ